MSRALSTHDAEPHHFSLGFILNSLRAAVLGANDGIVSTAALIIGVAAGTSSARNVALAGIAAVVAGAASMGLGEYLSVSSQRDTEKSLISKERRELVSSPAAEFDELVGLYEKKGLSPSVALAAVKELTEKDALAAHLHIELGIDPKELTNPIVAAISSAVSFTVGGLIPLFALLLAPENHRILIIALSVIFGLTITGYISAVISKAPKRYRIVARMVIGGCLAMLFSYFVGNFVDSHVIKH